MNQKTRKLLPMTLALGFLLGIHRGNVALWRDGEARPEQVYHIRADTLPPADRLQLSRGIRAESREKVWLLLENYFD